MYLHLGAEVNVRRNEIVGIFDLDTASETPLTREYLKIAQKGSYLHSVNEELPKSFVVLQKKDGTQEVYFSQISAAVLKKRCKQSVSLYHEDTNENQEIKPHTERK